MGLEQVTVRSPQPRFFSDHIDLVSSAHVPRKRYKRKVRIQQKKGSK